MVNLNGEMVDNMKENGKKVRCMVKGNIKINIIKLLKEYGFKAII